MIVREINSATLNQYIARQVAIGYTALSDIVSRTFRVESGRCCLIMPENLDLEERERRALERIEGWNEDPGRVKWRLADAILARHIKNYLSRARSRVMIQDFEGRRTDSSFTDNPLRSFYGEHLLWELQGPGVAEDKSDEYIGEASCWPWICYFCKERPRDCRDLTDEDLEEVARTLVGIGLQALHDSYLIWWRTDLEPFPAVQSSDG